jgi:hypothetical protein
VISNANNETILDDDEYIYNALYDVVGYDHPEMELKLDLN